MNYLCDIKDSYKNGYYTPEIYKPDIWKPDYVIDENFTIKENRLKIEQHNEEEKTKAQCSRDEANSMWKKFAEDCIEAIMYENSVSRKVAETIYNFSYDTKHHCMYEFFDYVGEIADFATDIIGAYKNCN